MRGYNVEQSVLLEEGSGWGVAVTKLLKQLKRAGGRLGGSQSRTAFCAYVRHPPLRRRKGDGKLRLNEAEGGSQLARSGC